MDQVQQLDTETLKMIIEQIKNEKPKTKRKRLNSLMKDLDIKKLYEETLEHSNYRFYQIYVDSNPSSKQQSHNSKYKGIPYSTTKLLEHPSAQNQTEILAKLDLNQKMKLIEELVQQCNHPL
jgi:hypothetical protein